MFPRPIRDKCPYAANPDLTGCDCDCRLPPPSGFWRRLLWLFDPLAHVCDSGPLWCGDGRLPCARFTKYKRSQPERTGDVA